MQRHKMNGFWNWTLFLVFYPSRCAHGSESPTVKMLSRITKRGTALIVRRGDLRYEGQR